ncbi:MAG: glycosyltransferase [Planctomycetales bacterium]
MPASVPPFPLAFCITDLDPGGAERALVQLVTRLDRREWEPTVLCLAGPGALVEVLRQAEIPVICLGARSARDVGVLFRLRRELRRLQPQIIQSFLFHANILSRIAGTLAGVPHRLSGIRVAERRSRWPLRLDRLTQGLVETNVCVSRGVAEFSATVGGISRNKLIVIPNGVDARSIAAAEPLDLANLGIPAGARVIVAVGRLDRQKGLEYLLDAAAQVAPAHPQAHWLLVGDGPERERLQAQRDRLGLSDRVHFAGRRTDVAAILRSAWALALPSLWEGMPNVVLEGMAAGLPVVASNVEGIAELVQDQTTGLVVSPGSPGALAAGMLTLLSDPPRAQTMGSAGQAFVREHCSWERMAADYQALYRRLLFPGGTAP